MALPDHFQAIEDHLDHFFDESDEILVFDEIKSEDFHLDVYWIKPKGKRNYHILLTNGVSSSPLNVPDESFSPYIELAVLLPAEWKLGGDDWKQPENYWPMELLKSLGRYPHEHGTWLGFGHSVPQPADEPVTGTQYTSTVLLKSKTLPAEFQSIPYKNSSIEIYLLFPLFEKELKYKKEHGTGSLLEKFAKNTISDIINIERKCAV